MQNRFECHLSFLGEIGLLKHASLHGRFLLHPKKLQKAIFIHENESLIPKIVLYILFPDCANTAIIEIIKFILFIDEWKFLHTLTTGGTAEFVPFTRIASG